MSKQAAPAPQSAGMCEAPPISLFSLRFREPAIEAAFMEHFASGARFQDIYGGAASILQLIPGTLVAVNRGIHGCGSLIGISWAIHVLQLLVLARAPRFYQKHRMLLVLLALGVARVLTGTRVPGCSADGSAATRWLYKTGIIPLAWYNIILPLPWRMTVLTQLAAVALYQWQLVPPGCRLLTSQPDTLPGVLSMWPRIRAMADAYLALVHGRLPPGSSQTARVVAGADADGPAAALGMCWSSIASIHLVVGLLLPLPLLYLLELKRRRAFFRQLLHSSADQQQLQQQQQPGQDRPVSYQEEEDQLLAAFHVPVAAVLVVTAAMGAGAMAAIMHNGPLVQQLLQRG